MNKIKWALTVALLLLAAGALQCGAVELRVSREALERTLKQQLFSGPNGRFYLKGTERTACSVYADDAKVNFEGPDRRKGEDAGADGQIHGAAPASGFRLSPTVEVSMAPYGEGESIGFRDAQLMKVSDQRELNFLADTISEPAGAIEHEGGCSRFAAQGAGGVDGDVGVQGVAGAAEGALDGDRGRRAGGGCGWGYQREVKELRIAPIT